MSKINDLNKFVEELKQKNIPIVLCEDFQPLAYHGQVCKLIVGGSIQHYLFEKEMNDLRPLPVHKNHGVFENSLRQRAKKVIGSKVGEVYGAKQIADLFNYNHFATDSYLIKDKANYEDFIIAALNQKQPVMVYFDVTPRLADFAKSGEPGNFSGKLEHASAIIGYYYIDNKLQLIATEWQNFYQFSLDALFASTSQLNKIKQPEHYVKYYPMPTIFNRKTWMEKNQMAIVTTMLSQEKPIKGAVYSFLNTIWPTEKTARVSDPSQSEELSLANILTIITGNKSRVDLSQFNDYKLKFNGQENNTNNEKKLAP